MVGVKSRQGWLGGLALAPLIGLATVTLGSGARGDAVSSGSTSSHPRTIGLVLTSWSNALVETPGGRTECPAGLQPGEVAQLKAMPGAIDRIKTYGGTFENRGPNGETGNYSPLAVEDPLPFSELKTDAGYGFNLDGTQDGHATDKTCRHQKFTSSQGDKIDNQLSRVIGCVQGYRTGGMMSDYYSQEIATFAVNRHLIEISGVDSEVNDPAVSVTIYKGYDRVVRASDGKFVPGLSQRIDERYPQYTMRTTGRIVDGVLITNPIANAVLPHSSERIVGDRVMRDMVLRLKLTADGADGMLGGYDNWGHWYNIHSKRVVAEVGKYSSPSIYRAFQRYADGYPDPKTGQCTFISSAYKVTAVRAMITHENAKRQSTAAID